MARRNLTGVLLVGGASRRFGSPKALASLDGETLAERGWRILGEACAERLAVGKRADALPLPFPLVDDAASERHPAAGLIAGLRAAAHDVCVFVPVDCPALRPATIRALGEACSAAAIPSTGGPLPAAYHRSALPALERCLAAGRDLRSALDELDVRTVPVDPWELANVNAPADLAAARRRERALAAAADVAAAHGLSAPEARILQDWNDTIVHLAPHPVVARVATSWVATDREATHAREIAVALHVAARGELAVRPSPLLPPGPHRARGLVLAFWELLEQEPGEMQPLEAGEALRELHAALADFSGPLPPLEERHARAAAVLADNPPELDPSDRELLERAFAELRRRVAARTREERVLHGGPHESNLLRTRRGLRWIDLDTVCRGPLEWDLAHLPNEAAAAFPEADLELLDAMRALLSAEVAIWCWHSYGRAPEVDGAARYHLQRVRELTGR